LGLIAVGSGGIKPCVSAHVGDQFGKSNWHLLEKIYNAFYFIINFGSAFATLIIPAIRGAETSPGVYEGSVGWAFGVPGILMGLATIAFWMGRNAFIHVPATHPGKKGLLDVVSGTFLFVVIGWPIFFGGMTAKLFDLNGANGKPVEWAGVSSVVWVCLIISLACLVIFAVLFNMRQRIEPDDGFLALTFLAVKAKLFGFKGKEVPYVQQPGVDDLRGHWFYGSVARSHGSAVAEGPMAVWKIISVFIFISVFWALFDQHSSTWIEQAKAMDRVVELSTTGNYLTGIGIGLLFVVIIALSAGKELPVWAMMAAGATVGGVVYWITGVAGQRSYGMWEWITLTGIMAGGAGAFFGIGQVNRSKWLICAVFLGLGAGVGYALTHIGRIELQPSQIPALNPFMVMVLIPLTTFGLYPLMKKIGINPHPLRRMTMGMMVAGISFVLVALLQAKLDSGEKVHVVWQVLPYLVITLAEVMVSITGLEFAYSQAPKRMKSVIMGFWLFNVTLGNLLVAVIAQMPDMAPEKFFWTFAGMMFGAGALFGLRGKFYKYKDYTQDAETPGDKETAETFA
jgi:dipeptide/tripeptide permease